MARTESKPERPRYKRSNLSLIGPVLTSPSPLDNDNTYNGKQNYSVSMTFARTVMVNTTYS